MKHSTTVLKNEASGGGNADEWRTPSPTARPGPVHRGVWGLVNEHNAKRLWMLVAFCLMILNAVVPVVLVTMLRQPQLVIALDGAQTFHIGPGTEFNRAKEIFEVTALLATQALLSRSPVGYDMPEILRQLFLPDALAKTKKDIEASSIEIKNKQLHWKPEVDKIEMVESGRDNYLVRARGQIIKSGMFQGQPVREVERFSTVFRLLRNPRLTQNNRYPLAVYDYTYSGETGGSVPKIRAGEGGGR